MAQRDQRPQQVLATVGHEVVVRVHPHRVVEAVDEAGRLQGRPQSGLHSAPVLQLNVAHGRPARSAGPLRHVLHSHGAMSTHRSALLWLPKSQHSPFMAVVTSSDMGRGSGAPLM